MEFSHLKKSSETIKEEFGVSNLLFFFRWKQRRLLSDKNHKKAVRLIYQFISGNLTDISERDNKELETYLSNIIKNKAQLSKLFSQLGYSEEDINKIIYRFIELSITNEFDKVLDVTISLNKDDTQETLYNSKLCVKDGPWVDFKINSIGNNRVTSVYEIISKYQLKEVRLVQRTFLKSVIKWDIKLSDLIIDLWENNQEQIAEKVPNNRIKWVTLTLWAITAAVSIHIGTILFDKQIVEEDTPNVDIKVKFNTLIHESLRELSEIQKEIDEIKIELWEADKRIEYLKVYLDVIKVRIRELEQKRVNIQVEQALNSWNREVVLIKSEDINNQSISEDNWENLRISCQSIELCLKNEWFSLREIYNSSAYKQMFNEVNPNRMSKEQVDFYVEQIKKELRWEISVNFDKSSLKSQETLRSIGLNIWDECVYENTKQKWMKVKLDSIIWENIILQSLEHWNKFAVYHENFKARYLWAI